MRDTILLFKLSSLWHGLRHQWHYLRKLHEEAGDTVLSLLLTSGTCPERHRPEAWAKNSHWAAGSQETCYEKVKITGKEPLYFLPQMKLSAGRLQVCLQLHTYLSASFLSSPFSPIWRTHVNCASRTTLTQGNRNEPYTWHIQLHRTWQTIITRNEVKR